MYILSYYMFNTHHYLLYVNAFDMSMNGTRIRKVHAIRKRQTIIKNDCFSAAINTHHPRVLYRSYNYYCYRERGRAVSGRNNITTITTVRYACRSVANVHLFTRSIVPARRRYVIG